MTNDDSTDGYQSVLSRREMLSTTGFAAATAAGLTAVSQQASAQTGTEPRISLGDAYTIDDDPDGNGDLVISESGNEVMRYDSDTGEWSLPAVSVGEIANSGPIYAGAQDGSSADARLDNALSQASGGDTVQLELTEDYNSDRTISAPIQLVGAGVGGTLPNAGARTSVGGTWTLDARIIVQNTIFLTAPNINMQNIVFNLCAFFSDTTVSADAVKFNLCDGATRTLTFESGTSGGIVDTTSRFNVVDNGSNTIGDVA